MNQKLTKLPVLIGLVFYDWIGKDGKSIYNTEEGVDLSMGDFHSGSTFKGTIVLDSVQLEELEEASKKGISPVFWVSPRWEERKAIIDKAVEG